MNHSALIGSRNQCLHLSTETKDEADRIFNDLSEGGSVEITLLISLEVGYNGSQKTSSEYTGL